MSQHLPPTKPTFEQRFTATQKLMVQISGSCGLMAGATLLPFVKNFFQPNGILFLSYLGMAFATMALVLAAFSGIPQIKVLIVWLFDMLEYYKKFVEFKKLLETQKKEEENSE